MLIEELVIDLVTPPLLTVPWLLFVRVNNWMVERNGKGSRIEPRSLQTLIQFYLVAILLSAIHLLERFRFTC